MLSTIASFARDLEFISGAGQILCSTALAQRRGDGIFLTCYMFLHSMASQVKALVFSSFEQI